MKKELCIFIFLIFECLLFAKPKMITIKDFRCTDYGFFYPKILSCHRLWLILLLGSSIVYSMV